jgi:hypothetical protein
LNSCELFGTWWPVLSVASLLTSVISLFNMPSFSYILTVLAWFTFFHGEVIAAGANTTSIPFRIMSLGASVTFGTGSTTGDSYRKDLEDLLVSNGNTVSYVGTKNNGNFADNAVEAVPGFVISQIAGLANAAVSLIVTLADISITLV